MRFLIVKSSSLGDIVHSFPVIDYLKRKHPNSQIDWIVEKPFASLVLAHPDLNEIHIVNTKKWRRKLSTWKELFAFRKHLRSNTYDAVFDLQGNTKSALFILWTRAKHKVGFSLSSAPEKTNIFVTNKRYSIPPHLDIRERYLRLAQSYFLDDTPFTPNPVSLRLSPEEEKKLKKLILPGAVMVCFGSRWPNKQISIPTLKQFLTKIEAENFYIIYGNEQEKKGAENLGIGTPIGGLSIPLWQALMHHSMCVITMDSASLYLAALTDTPTFSIFGPSSSKIYAPKGEKHISIQGICPYGKQFVHRCPILRTCKTGACIKNITSEQLLKQFQRINLQRSAQLCPSSQ